MKKGRLKVFGKKSSARTVVATARAAVRQTTKLIPVLPDTLVYLSCFASSSVIASIVAGASEIPVQSFEHSPAFRPSFLSREGTWACYEEDSRNTHIDYFWYFCFCVYRRLRNVSVVRFRFSRLGWALATVFPARIGVAMTFCHLPFVFDGNLTPDARFVRATSFLVDDGRRLWRMSAVVS